MNYTNLITAAVLAAIVILCIRLFRKSGKFFRSLFLSAASGIGGIIAVNLISTLTAVSVPLTPVTALFSASTGLSGVISLVLWQVIFSR